MQHRDRNRNTAAATGWPPRPTAFRVAVVWREDESSDASEIVSQLKAAGYHTVELTDLGAVMAEVQGEFVKVVAAVLSSLQPKNQELELRRWLAGRHPDVCLIEAWSYPAQPAFQWYMSASRH